MKNVASNGFSFSFNNILLQFRLEESFIMKLQKAFHVIHMQPLHNFPLSFHQKVEIKLTKLYDIFQTISESSVNIASHSMLFYHNQKLFFSLR